MGGYVRKTTRPGETKMKNKTVRIIALYGVMLAVLFAAMMIDRLISAYNVLSFAVASVAVTAAFALSRRSFAEAAGAGFFFGIASFVTAFYFGKEAFYNPLVSVLPRALTGITGLALYLLCEKLFGLFVKNETVRQYAALSVAGGAVALSNTIYTLTCLFLFAQGSPTFVAFSTVFLTNVLPELLITVIATPPLVLGVRHGLRLNADGSVRAKRTENPEKEKAAAVAAAGN